MLLPRDLEGKAHYFILGAQGCADEQKAGLFANSVKIS